MNEILEIRPLVWMNDQLGDRYYSEHTIDEIKACRKQKSDISARDLQGRKTVLTHYEIKKYGDADTLDHYLYFVLPKYEKHIRDRFKVSISSMTHDQRSKLTYNQIRNTVDRWIKDEEYYQ